MSAGPDRHITDEEIHEAAGGPPRDPPGLPKATCLGCLNEHSAYYASQACTCRVELAARSTYAEWLVYFQRLGFGVLRTPEDKRFPRWDMVISGRQMLTFHLQSDLFVGPQYTLDERYYFGPDWVNDAFPSHDSVEPKVREIYGRATAKS